MRVGLCVPILNPGKRWHEWLAALAEQTLRLDQVVVLDSMSNDGSAKAASIAGHTVVPVQRESFDHGATRQLAVEMMHQCDVIVFLTQDAMLARPDALERLVAVLSQREVALAWGRQLPHADATPIAQHARYFNYPAVSRTVSLADRATLGMKVAFCSNSFAAWRRSTLMEIDGFAPNVLLGEDTLACAKLLLQGWQVSYVADAVVYHSHNYTKSEEFRRYFDIGAMHAMTPWFLQTFGGVSGEGKRFVQAEQSYLASSNLSWRISAIIRTLLKYLAYQLGRKYRLLPLIARCYLGMHTSWWRKQCSTGED